MKDPGLSAAPRHGCMGSLGRSSLGAGEVFPLEGAMWSTAPLCSPPPAVTWVHTENKSLNSLLLCYGRLICPVGVMGSFFEAEKPSSCPVWQPGPSLCRTAPGQKCSNGYGPLFFPPTPRFQLWPASRH